MAGEPGARCAPGPEARWRRAVLTCLLPAAVLVTGGCWDRLQLDDAAYIITLGIDRAESGRLLVTARVADVHQLGAGLLGGHPGGQQAATRLFSAEGETVNKALYVLNAGSTRRMDLRHLRSVVVGEPLARGGLEPTIAELARHPWARGTATLAQSTGRALDAMRVFDPVLDRNPGRAQEGLALQAKYLHMAPPVRLHHFLVRLAAAGADPILPVSGINPAVLGKEQEPRSSAGESALPGTMPRIGGNPVDWAGTAVFRRDRLVGFLTVDETQMLLALSGRMGKAYVTLPDPNQPDQSVTLRFHQENLPQSEARLAGGRPRVQTRLLFEGELLAAPVGTDYSRPESRAQLQAAAAAFANARMSDLLEKLKAWRADPVGYGNLFRRHFATWPEWEDFRWEDRVADLQVDVEVDMRLRRYGLLLGADHIAGPKGR